MQIIDAIDAVVAENELIFEELSSRNKLSQIYNLYKQNTKDLQELRVLLLETQSVTQQSKLALLKIKFEQCFQLRKNIRIPELQLRIEKHCQQFSNFLQIYNENNQKLQKMLAPAVEIELKLTENLSPKQPNQEQSTQKVEKPPIQIPERPKKPIAAESEILSASVRAKTEVKYDLEEFQTKIDQIELKQKEIEQKYEELRKIPQNIDYQIEEQKHFHYQQEEKIQMLNLKSEQNVLEISQQQMEIEDLNTKLLELQSVCMMNEQSVILLQEEVNKHNFRAAEANNKKQSEMQQMQSIFQNIDQLKLEIANIQQSISSNSSDLAKQNQQIRNMNAKIIQREKEIADAKADKTQQKNEMFEVQRQLKEFSLQCDFKIQQLSTLSNSLSEQVNDQNDQLQNQENEIAKIKDEIKKEVQKFKIQLFKSQNSNIQDKLKTMATMKEQIAMSQAQSTEASINFLEPKDNDQ